MNGIKIENDFTLERDGYAEMFYLRNICDLCGFVGEKWYAYDDYQHYNCADERKEHRKTCKQTLQSIGITGDDE